MCVLRLIYNLCEKRTKRNSKSLKRENEKKTKTKNKKGCGTIQKVDE